MAAPNPLDDVYGAFQRVTPSEVAALLDGYPGKWWICGGWAIEAFTGVERPHEDIDVGINRLDLPVLINHFAGTHHVWAAGSGSLKALTDPNESFPDWAGQAWVRANATSPWLVDFLLTQVVDEQWLFKRDPFIQRPLEDATWIGENGIVYEAPEICLLYKAKHARDKDRRDFEMTLPHLEADAAEWLAKGLRRSHPGHPWLEKL